MDNDNAHLLGGLLASYHLASVEDLPALVAHHAAPAGFSHPVLYVADLQHQFLVPLPGQHEPDGGSPPERLRIDTSLAGLVYRTLEQLPQSYRTDDDPGTSPLDPAGPPPAPADPHRWWLPLRSGGERIGVLAITLPDDGDTTRERAAQLAALTAMMLAGKRSTSDTYAELVRTQPMQLSAEVLWTMLPVRTFATEQVVISAALEPAYLVGGDAFDYALTGHHLHMSIFDSMGHDIRAGLTSAIAIGACRNHRRRGVDLVAIGEAIDEAIAEEFDRTQFATGVLADLDTRTGLLTWINRGHCPPLVLRDGHLVATLDSEPDPPMGFRMGATQAQSRYQLEPGDRLLFYTDGIIEARDPKGNQFGLDTFVDFVIRREADGLSAPETLRRLIQTLLDHHQDRLQDDATVMLVEWNTPVDGPA